MDHLTKRDQLVHDAISKKYSGLTFTPEEERANHIFKKITQAASDTVPIKFHTDAMTYRKEVEATELFSIIRKMPKGSHHHCHLDSQMHWEFLVKKTYEQPNVYLQESTQTIKIFSNKDADTSGWSKIDELRKKAGDNVKEFDASLQQYFTLMDSERHSDKLWAHFERKIFNRLEILKYARHWEDAVYSSFVDSINEGATNFQARFFINSLLDDEDKPVNVDDEMQIYERCIAKAKKLDPDFTFHLIVQGLRFWDDAKLKEYVGEAYAVKRKYPHLVIGFDLVAEEKLRRSQDFAPIFEEHLKIQEATKIPMPFILHAGETTSLNNDNIIDSILLKSPRIGHGLNLVKHASLMDIVKKMDICIENNPLSNQILQYVGDLRLHPMITYLHYGLRVSVSSDDDGVFNTSFLNWDFFACAFSMELDLKDFKKLCMDSIECSVLEAPVQKRLKEVWSERWAKFVDALLQ
jgi:adenosine deaminase CECR1